MRHIIRVEHYEGDDFLTLCMMLNVYLPWHKRLWNAIVYVFNPTESNTVYDATLLSANDAYNLSKVIDRFLIDSSQT
jgi:hypothetical protein